MSIKRSFTVRGKYYDSIIKFSKEHDISTTRFHKALERFDLLDELKYSKAAEYLLSKKEKEEAIETIKISVWEYKFTSYKEVANFFDISLNALYKRMSEFKEDVATGVEFLLGMTKTEWHKQKELETLKNKLLIKGFI